MTPILPSFRAFLPPGAELIQRSLRLSNDQQAMSLGVVVPFALHPQDSPAPIWSGSLWDAVGQALGKTATLDEAWPKLRGELLAAGTCYPPAGHDQWPISAHITAGPIDKRLAISQNDTQVSGFAPLAPEHPARQAYAGAHDHAWLKARWPHHATDTDPLFFQQAPKDQWLDGFWAGGDTILIRNMHPQHPDLVGRVPQDRIRCFTHQTQPDGNPSFKELDAHLDTLWLLPEAQLGLVIYRALCPTHTPDGRDINALLAEYEAPDAPPLTIDHYVQLCIQKMSGQVALPPETKKLQTEAEQLSSQQLLAKVLQQKESFQAILQAEGVDDQAMIAQMLAHPQTRQFAQAIQQRNGSISGFFAEIEGLLKAFDDAEAEQLQHLAQQFKPPALSLASVMPPALITAQYAPEFPPAPAAPTLQDPTLATQRRQQVLALYAQGRPCSGLDLSQANLAGLDLAGANFSASVLSGANLAGAKLQGANFSQAILQGARLDAADLSGCQLNQSTLDQASLAGAKLNGATLDGSNCHGANFAGADLSGVSLQGAGLSKAWLQQIQAPQLQADGADFSHANLEGCNLSQAHLDQANFTGARLARIQLDGASCRQANFTLADISHASLRRCDLSDSQCTPGTQWQGSKLQAAILNGASWTGAMLDGACLDEIQAQGTDLSDARLDNAQVTQADLRKANLDRASLRHAVFRRSNLMEASFNHTDLSHCQILDSNLYAASFIDTVLDTVTVAGCNTDATILPVRL
ncbi:DUF2169 family type VI secretion system accessory protein [Castellaniella sp.]|uniref:DUF2169 family type VI secretion system accessory protein n=1 Tax=Castellaniella sp. TaxID=1955812 RepID=UPI002B002384|nr:pentapeptide repeat-containing protein [Castellaniella sp.]